MSFGYDGGAFPSLGLIRLAIVLTAEVGPIRAHVRITVTGNNMNEQAFTRTVLKSMSTQADASKRYVLEYGPGQRVASSAIKELIRFINDIPVVSAVDLLQQEQRAYAVIAHPSNYSNEDIASSQMLLLWKPILLIKIIGGFSGSSVKVLNGFIIAFLGNGHYVLIKGSVAIWQSSQPSSELFPQSALLAKGAAGTPKKASTSNPFEGNKPVLSPGSGYSGGPGYNSGGNPIHGESKLEPAKGK